MQMITIFTGLHEGPFKFDKNPEVGEFPNSQDLSLAVLNPNPNNLSKKAHKNINPKAILKTPKV